MKFLGMILLLVLAASAWAEHDVQSPSGCTEDEIYTECLSPLLDLADGEPTTDEACQITRGMYECLQNKADDCVSEEGREELADDFANLEMAVQSNCGASSNDNDKIEECLDEVEDYLESCVDDRSEEILDDMMGMSEAESQRYQCILLYEVGGCIVDRAAEKCGEIAGAYAHRKLSESLPKEAQEVCASLLEKKKKK